MSNILQGVTKSAALAELFKGRNQSALTWVEVSRSALAHNISEFRKLIGDKILCPCVKANAYGHGLIETSKIYTESGADWLGVNALYEAQKLRAAGIDVPIYILGYTEMSDLGKAAHLGCSMVVYNKESIDLLSKVDAKVKVHLKMETGNNRQGLVAEELVEFGKYIQQFENIEVEGVCTHFANIEDTTDHTYAEKQIESFESGVKMLNDVGIHPKFRHCANSAATILFPKTHFDLVRPGISTYGLWPSNETYVSYLKESRDSFSLMPAFTWKTKIAQVKEIGANEYIGYGCTFRTTSKTRLAILPVGYYDGYDRCVSNAHVLIHGKRAPVRGRVCMNIMMVDVTHIPEAKLEDEVVLIGKGGEEEISIEQFADWAGTINYEIPTRVNERIPRRVV